jgi:hypothetical protein
VSVRVCMRCYCILKPLHQHTHLVGATGGVYERQGRGVWRGGVTRKMGVYAVTASHYGAAVKKRMCSGAALV